MLYKISRKRYMHTLLQLAEVHVDEQGVDQIAANVHADNGKE